MKIKNIKWQHRNDFEAVLECEHCGWTQDLKYGYDDLYYHTKVLPSIPCKNCLLDRSGNTTDHDSWMKKPVDKSTLKP